MFDPNAHKTAIEAYVQQHLGKPVTFVAATELPKSTRNAPWRVDVRVAGTPRSFVLRLDAPNLDYEYTVLKALMPLPVPTQSVYGWDAEGQALGTPCYFADYIDGDSLLPHMMAGEPWAETLYLDAVLALNAITPQDLGQLSTDLNHESALDVLEDAHAYFVKHPRPLVRKMYVALKTSTPDFPKLRFSNGDLWLDNFLVKDQHLVGIIDFENAGFTNPIYEFGLSFFARPALRKRDIEARYCQHVGVDPVGLAWYYGLEFYDTLRWLLITGKPFESHTVENLERDIRKWLARSHPMLMESAFLRS